MPVITLLSVPFAFLLGGFVFSGLLGPLAADLGISVSAAGLLQAGYALGCAFAGPFLAHWTRHRRKKPLLLTVLGSMVLLNVASILAPGFNELLFLRTALGITGALSLPLAVSIAVTLVAPEQRGGAIAKVYSGVAYALMLGMPAGSLAGDWLGWRASFGVAALASAAALVLVWRNVPDIAAQPVPKGSAGLDARSAGLLASTYLAFGAMFCLVGYIGPVVTSLTGGTGTHVALFQLGVGLSCLAGLTLGARIAATLGGRGLAWLFAGIALGLAVLVPPLSTNPPLLVNILALVVSVALAPVCQFATAPVVQGSLAATAGPSTTFVLTLNSSMVYLGQGTGVLLGGTAISFGGYAAAPLTGAFVALLGLVVAVALRSGSARSLSRT